jgi:hypothetical protein
VSREAQRMLCLLFLVLSLRCPLFIVISG